MSRIAWKAAKTKVASAVAIVSLALSAAACNFAFGLIDQLLRGLPIANPQRPYDAVRHRRLGAAGV